MQMQSKMWPCPALEPVLGWNASMYVGRGAELFVICLPTLLHVSE